MKCAVTYRTPRISYLRRPYLPGGDAHFFVLPQLHRIYNLIIVRSDVANHFLVLRVFAKQSFHLSCKQQNSNNKKTRNFSIMYI